MICDLNFSLFLFTSRISLITSREMKIFTFLMSQRTTRPRKINNSDSFHSVVFTADLHTSIVFLRSLFSRFSARLERFYDANRSRLPFSCIFSSKTDVHDWVEWLKWLCASLHPATNNVAKEGETLSLWKFTDNDDVRLGKSHSHGRSEREKYGNCVSSKKKLISLSVVSSSQSSISARETRSLTPFSPIQARNAKFKLTVNRARQIFVWLLRLIHLTARGFSASSSSLDFLSTLLLPASLLGGVKLFYLEICISLWQVDPLSSSEGREKGKKKGKMLFSMWKYSTLIWCVWLLNYSI